MTGHRCPVDTAAGGAIQPSWCFNSMANVWRAMPLIVTETDVLGPDLLLAQSGTVTVRYCPFDYVNPHAKLVIVGITPGLHQTFLSCQEANEPWLRG